MILATIEGPTKEDPYRFLGVKWFTNEYPLGVSAIMQRRDFLIVEATGLAYDSNGETVGYIVYQSVEIPQVPELKELKIIRGYSSVCFINRQVTESTVGIFSRGFLDARGCLSPSVGIALIANSIISAVNIMECANMKKLTWILSQQNRATQLRARTNSRQSHCQACQKQLTRFATLLTVSASTCRICHEMVCAKCSVVKKVVVDSSMHCAVRKPFICCLRCLVTAKNLLAREVAIHLVSSSRMTTNNTSL